MTEEFTTDTTVMRELARRLDAVADQAGSLTNRALSGSGTPGTTEFPPCPSVSKLAGCGPTYAPISMSSRTRSTIDDALRLTGKASLT